MSVTCVRSRRHSRIACALTAFLAAPFQAGAGTISELTTWSYDESNLQYVDDSGEDPVWANYTEVPTVDSTPLFDGIMLFGTGDSDLAFSLTGAEYVPSSGDPTYRGNQLVISGTGTIDGAAWQHPQNFINTSFAFGLDFSGGTIDLYNISTGFTLYNGLGEFLIGVGSGTSLGEFDPGGYGFGFVFEDRFPFNYETAETFTWSVIIGFDWTGMADEDLMNFYIPQSSIDLQVLPEPGSAVLLGLGLVASVRRRRPILRRV